MKKNTAHRKKELFIKITCNIKQVFPLIKHVE